MAHVACSMYSEASGGACPRRVTHRRDKPGGSLDDETLYHPAAAANPGSPVKHGHKRQISP